ncbi:protein-disulfide reductase DsbD domain-containing protein [Pseudoalteromonas sp. T1lg23B]|uniref:protein-disulfide reductase DsbD domain-containing protein n=1 Tax=Pseudoalteromonas sp. T1lg23B TaxID=2077097 RepID=UPI00131A30AC|nr:protein-disulfide reductase DsbD domain-containing protein [Pseudoalteromonas sp. T1lg23B]
MLPFYAQPYSEPIEFYLEKGRNSIKLIAEMDTDVVLYAHPLTLQFNGVKAHYQLPQASLYKLINTPFYGYTNKLSIPLHIGMIGEHATLSVSYRACHLTKQVCYPPSTQHISMIN